MNKKNLLIGAVIIALFLATTTSIQADETPPIGEEPTEPTAKEPQPINRINYQTNETDLGEGKFAQTSHLGFINYKDGEEFKPIDMTLIDYGTYWKTTESVYYPTIPRYADEWGEFNNVYEGNDHSIKVRPISAHIEGIANGNVVLYPNAYGPDIDLEVTAYNGHLLRKIIIRKPQTEALYFDFEIEIDGKLNYKSVDAERVKADITLDVSLKTKSIEFEEGKTPTTIYPMRVWDSSDIVLSELIDYKFYEDAGKLYFRKFISKEFLENAVYPVYTDDDTGATNPGTMADDAAVGTLTWSNPDNAKTSNNSWAIASTGGTAQTHYLKATNFGFSFSGTINGIIAKIEKQMANGGQPDTTVDNAVKIVKSNGSIGAENKAVGPNWNQNADATVTYGDSTDLWSESWSDTDITDVDFGFVVTADLTRVVGPGPNAYVDHMTITVYYTAGVSDSCSCPESGNWEINDGSICTLSTLCNAPADVHISSGSLNITASGELVLASGNKIIIQKGEFLYTEKGGKIVIEK